MAIVIPFVPGRRAREIVVSSEGAATGSILFFTGVRYERHPEPAAAPEALLRTPGGKAALRTKGARRAKSAGQPA